MTQTLHRRTFMLGATLAAAGLAAPSLVRADDAGVDANISSFRAKAWKDYFPSLRHGAILADTQSRAVHFWSEDEATYLLFPCSVPGSPDLTRTGMTEVVEKVVGPTWRPTPSMRQRMPWLPAVVGPGPDNPLGPFALYLSWQYYRVHGTQDTRKIGRKSSDGCIGLYNEDITDLFKRAKVGTQVHII
ncbi:MAG: L,D-transpeptidase family protein [Rhodobacteraceae bacterium]|nr:L,D-transpeptidase family protein [Paracoccaceae bacterium]